MTFLLIVGNIFGWSMAILGWIYWSSEQQARLNLEKEIKDNKLLVQQAIEVSIRTGVTTNEALELLLRSKNSGSGKTRVRNMRIRR